LSSRNLERVKTITASELSTYGIMNANKVVLVENALGEIESNLAK
jgi:large subunit ribosomal protein L4